MFTYLSDDSEESYLSVQRFFLNKSADSSSVIDWFELVAFSTMAFFWLLFPLPLPVAVVIGIIEISLSWSAPLPADPTAAAVVVFVACCLDAGIIWDIFDFRHKQAVSLSAYSC